MGRKEVLDAIQAKKGERLTPLQIMEITKFSFSNVQRALLTLRRDKFIQFKMKGKGYEYWVD